MPLEVLMDNKTEDLMNTLKTTDINTYLSENSSEFNMTLPKYFNKLIQDKGITSTDLVINSKLEKSYCYQILNGTKKNPSRDKILAIAIGSKFTLEETQRALKIANVGILYAKSKRDSIIIYAIENHLGHIDTAALLEKYDQPGIEYSKS